VAFFNPQKFELYGTIIGEIFADKNICDNNINPQKFCH
jgi:hypothetical protein